MSKDSTFSNNNKKIFFLGDDIDNDSIGELTWNLLHQILDDDEKIKRKRIIKETLLNFI